MEDCNDVRRHGHRTADGLWYFEDGDIVLDTKGSRHATLTIGGQPITSAGARRLAHILIRCADVADVAEGRAPA